jgi:hypothetical protein
MAFVNVVGNFCRVRPPCSSFLNRNCLRRKPVVARRERRLTPSLSEKPDGRGNDTASGQDPLKPALMTEVPILRSSGVRAGYAVACIAAGLAGAPILAVSGAIFSVLSAATGAPTPLTSLAAVLVAVFIDLSSHVLQAGGDTTNVLGTSSEGFGFAVYIGIVAVLIFIDDDVEFGVSMFGSVDDAVRRVDRKTANEQRLKNDAQRVAMRRDLGLHDVNTQKTEDSGAPQQAMETWDKELEDKSN